MSAELSSLSSSITVGFVSPGWPPEAIANGIASYTGSIVGGLTELGTRCEVFTLRPMAAINDRSVHVVPVETSSFWYRIRRRIDPQGWPQRAFAQSLAQSVREFGQLDLLELEESYGWAGMTAGKCPVPTVVRLHGPWFLNGVANGEVQDQAFERRDVAERDGIAAATAVSAPSADVLNRTRQHFNLPLASAAVIPNPVTIPSGGAMWNLAECDPKRIAFIGRFDRHKGGDLALDAFARIAKKSPEAQLDFVGPDRGLVDNSEGIWSINRYLGQKLSPSARGKVNCHGFQPRSKAAQIRKRALVTIVPSRYETFGLAAAEAMMAGCPLVVAGAGALTELVQDRRNGLVAKPDDADDLADKVLALLNNPNWAVELGRQAAIDAAQRYAPQVVARQTLAFYRSVLGR
jgi:glycosyltransferase involved in cell wall biosynthesis